MKVMSTNLPQEPGNLRDRISSGPCALFLRLQPRQPAEERERFLGDRAPVQIARRTEEVLPHWIKRTTDRKLLPTCTPKHDFFTIAFSSVSFPIQPKLSGALPLGTSAARSGAARKRKAEKGLRPPPGHPANPGVPFPPEGGAWLVRLGRLLFSL